MKKQAGGAWDKICRRCGLLVLLAAIGTAVSAPGFGQDASADGSNDLWTRNSLTGDWGGWRSKLTDDGVIIGVSEVAELLGNASGGQKRGTVFAGRAELAVDLDLGKLMRWQGATIHANAFQIHGRGLTADTLGGNMFDPSNIEATRATRLFDLYLEQSLFDDTLSIRVGQIAADDEFLTSDYAGAFINGTFGWAGIMAADLPNGGPAYPLATPGVRVKWTPSKSFYWQTAVTNGDPAGNTLGDDDPQRRNHDGLTFSIDKNVFVISEIGYSVVGDEATLPASFKLGGWYHSARFENQRYDVDGGLAAVTGADPRRESGDYGFYAVADKLLWREAGTQDQGLGAFLWIGAAPGDRNLVPFYFDTGLNYIGPIEGRDSDVLGLAFAFAKISGRAADFDRDYNSANPSALRPVRDYEAAIELSYTYVAAPWWTIQPDIQYIVHPAANCADPDADPSQPAPAMKNAFVLGVRTAVQF